MQRIMVKRTCRHLFCRGGATNSPTGAKVPHRGAKLRVQGHALPGNFNNFNV